MKSRALWSRDFVGIILSSSSLLLARGPAVSTVIYLANLKIADPEAPRRLGARAPGGAWAPTANPTQRWLRQSPTDVLSDISSDILSGIFSDILSDISSGIFSPPVR